MKSFTILFLSSAHEMTASYFRAFFLAKYLVKEGHRVLLVLSSKKATLDASKKVVDGVDVYLLPSLVMRDVNLISTALTRVSTSFMQAFLNFVLEGTSDFDVLHSFDVVGPQNAVPTLLSRISRLLKIHDGKIFTDWDDLWARGGILSLYRGVYPIMAPLLGFLEEKVPTYADGVTVTNDTLKRHAMLSGVKSENLFIIPNGVDTESTEPLSSNDAREKVNLPARNVIYTFVTSSTQDLQDFKILMSAHAKVLKHHPNAILVLVGRISKNQMGLVESYGVTRNVICVGPQPDYQFRLYLSASDVLLLPMRDSTYNRARSPLRLGDYLAAGRPVVSTALPEIEKIVNECGYVARPGDPDDFAHKILEVTNNPSMCKKLGRRARELAERRYSWKILAQRLEKIYDHYL